MKKNNIVNSNRKFDLQERFIDYAVSIIKLPESKAGKHICGQILRSGTSPPPNYSEAQSAESRADFNHKLKDELISILFKSIETAKKSKDR